MPPNSRGMHIPCKSNSLIFSNKSLNILGNSTAPFLNSIPILSISADIGAIELAEKFHALPLVKFSNFRKSFSGIDGPISANSA